MAKVTRTGIEDRRDYTPPGRLRRIAHDYRGTTVALLVGVLIAAGLFVATSAWAGDARMERGVAEMVYSRDERSLEFMRRKEAELTQRVAAREAVLARKEEELAPRDKPYLVVSLAERRVLYIKGNDTLYRAPVAIGSGETIVI